MSESKQGEAGIHMGAGVGKPDLKMQISNRVKRVSIVVGDGEEGETGVSRKALGQNLSEIKKVFAMREGQ